MLRQISDKIKVETRGRGFVDLTADIHGIVERAAITEGLLTLFIRHTSASLVVQENADPDVRGDLQRFLARLVPDGDALYRHRDEGPDDMPAHIRSVLTAVQVSIPIDEGRLVLGTWQAVYLWEHRRRPHVRQVAVHIIGE